MGWVFRWGFWGLLDWLVLFGWIWMGDDYFGAWWAVVQEGVGEGLWWWLGWWGRKGRGEGGMGGRGVGRKGG